MESNTGMKMMITTMPVRGFIATFAMFLSVFLCCIIIGSYGPQVYHYRQVSSYRCPSDVTVFDPDAGCEGVDLAQPNSKWSGEIQHLDKLNQEISLRATLTNKEYQTTGFVQDVSFQIGIAGKNEAEGEWQVIRLDDAHNRTVTCKQGNILCENMTLAWDLYVRYPFYQFNVSIMDAGAFLGDVYFTFIFVDHSYTLFELWFRFAFLILTFISIIIFAHRLRTFPWNEWTIEQKWTALLLFGLMAYNNPFYPLEVLVIHWFPIFLNRLLYGTFLVILFLFWLIMFDGFRYQESSQRKFITFYLPKFILIGLFWLFSVTVFTWGQLQLLDDPSYQTPSDKPGFIAVSVFLLLLLVIYLFWLVIVVCRACGDSKNMPFIHDRTKVFGVFTLLVTFTVVGGLMFGAFGKRYNNSAEFLSFLSLFNLYCFTLAFFYLPARKTFGTGSHSDKLGMVRLEEEEEPDGEQHELHDVEESTKL